MNIPLTIPDVLKQLVQSVLYDVHTTLPALVTKVDYSNGYLSVKPLIKDKRSELKIHEYPEIGDVPLWVYSGGTGSMTVPIKVGDTVALHFSEREATNFILSDGKAPVEPTEYAPLGLYPLYATPCVRPLSQAQPISPTDIVIANGSTTINIAPDGNVTVVTPTYNISGDLVVDGNISATGIIHSDIDVTGFDTSLESHIHGGVTSGPASTTPPTP